MTTTLRHQRLLRNSNIPVREKITNWNRPRPLRHQRSTPTSNIPVSEKIINRNRPRPLRQPRLLENGSFAVREKIANWNRPRPLRQPRLLQNSSLAIREKLTNWNRQAGLLRTWLRRAAYPTQSSNRKSVARVKHFKELNSLRPTLRAEWSPLGPPLGPPDPAVAIYNKEYKRWTYIERSESHGPLLVPPLVPLIRL